jgi:hypothetical protein
VYASGKGGAKIADNFGGAHEESHAQKTGQAVPLQVQLLIQPAFGQKQFWPLVPL